MFRVLFEVICAESIQQNHQIAFHLIAKIARTTRQVVWHLMLLPMLLLLL